MVSFLHSRRGAIRRRRRGRGPGPGRPAHEGPRQAAPARRDRDHQPPGHRPGRRREPDRRGRGRRRQRRAVDHGPLPEPRAAAARAGRHPDPRRRRHRRARPDRTRVRWCRSTATGSSPTASSWRTAPARPSGRSPTCSTSPARASAPSSSSSPRTPSSTSARRATSSSTSPTSRPCRVEFRGRHVLIVVRGHRLQERPRGAAPERLPQRDPAAAHRRRRRRRRAARDRPQARPDHRRLRLGVRADAALRRGAGGARLPGRPGAGRRAARRASACPTSCSSRPAPARTSRCCWPSSGAPS